MAVSGEGKGAIRKLASELPSELGFGPKEVEEIAARYEQTKKPLLSMAESAGVPEARWGQFSIDMILLAMLMEGEDQSWRWRLHYKHVGNADFHDAEAKVFAAKDRKSVV